MEVTVRQEAGYNLALYGMSLSFKDRAIKPEDWWDFKEENDCCCWETGCKLCFNPADVVDRMERLQKTATANAGRGKGHDKFLRQIMLWVDIEAPRYWWSEFDTYKVGTVAQSESTMHTLSKRDATVDDFQNKMVSIQGLKDLNFVLNDKETNIRITKSYLSESYLQRRLVTLNYGVLHTIIGQRKNHKLPEWRTFIEAIYEQVEHGELLPEYPYGNATDKEIERCN